MTITKAMLLDILNSNLKEYIANEAPLCFQRTEFLAAPQSVMDENVLYLLPPERLGQVKSLQAGSAYVFTVCSAGEAEAFFKKHSVNLLYVSETEDFYTVVNRISAGIERLYRWERQLLELTLSGKSIQQLTEHGAEIFGENPVVVGSSSYNVIGRSLLETPYNKNVSALLKRGYFVTQEADALSRMGYQAHREQYQDGVWIDPPSLMNCSFFLITLPKQLKRASFMAVYFVASQPSAGLMDIFRYYASILGSYIAQSEETQATKSSSFELFMDDLLNHTHEDELYLNDRAMQLQLPLNEPFRVGVIQWDEYSRDQAEYVLWRVRYGLGNIVFRVMRYHESLLMLVKGSMPSDEVEQRVNEGLSEFMDILSVGNGQIGFSTEVDSLLKLDVAYKMALSAARFGNLLAAEERLHFYSEYYIYDMIDSYSDRFKVADMYVQKLQLLDTKAEGKYNNLNLLRVYLLSERSLSDTARLLHLHRNSVIYRLGKIESILGVSLDRPDVRLRLLISFKMLEMHSGTKYPPLELEEKE